MPSVPGVDRAEPLGELDPRLAVHIREPIAELSGEQTVEAPVGEILRHDVIGRLGRRVVLGGRRGDNHQTGERTPSPPAP